MKLMIKRLFCRHDYQWCRKIQSFSGLNGMAYDDDKCICNACVIKLYSEEPQTYVRLEEINGSLH